METAQRETITVEQALKEIRAQSEQALRSGDVQELRKAVQALQLVQYIRKNHVAIGDTFEGKLLVDEQEKVWVGPDFETVAQLETDVVSDQMKNEPMFRKSSLQFVEEHCGPVTNLFLSAVKHLNPGCEDLIIDTRVHMLKPGWYPGIPGWHTDELWRGDDGQPDVENFRIKTTPVHYALALDIGTDSLTQFLTEAAHLSSRAHSGQNLYEMWTHEIGAPEPSYTARQVKSGELVRFGTSSIHRAMPAKGSGWRWWGRATKWSRRDPVNEIRRQSNVYVKLARGW